MTIEDIKVGQVYRWFGGEAGNETYKIIDITDSSITWMGCKDGDVYGNYDVSDLLTSVNVECIANLVNEPRWSLSKFELI